MKKFIFSILALGAITLTSCGHRTTNENTEATETDTVEVVTDTIVDDCADAEVDTVEIVEVTAE